MKERRASSGARDFDFVVGTWDVANRRLTQRLVGSTEWEEFPGTSECRSILGGSGNVQEIEFTTKGFSGAALRLFDPDREKWSIYWASSRTGLLEAPVVGRFSGGRGDFYGDDTHDGTPIRVHLIWSQITPTSAHWEQEFSADGGRTWEANWIMDFSRTGRGRSFLSRQRSRLRTTRPRR